MSRRISPLFSFFTTHFSFLLLHLFAELSAADLSSGGGILGIVDLDSVLNYGTSRDSRSAMENKYAKNGGVIKPNDRKTDSSVIRDRYSDPDVYKRENLQFIFEKASDQLYQKYNLSRDDMANNLPCMTTSSEMGQRMRDSCMQTVMPGQCDANAKYRTPDGSCNNLGHPDYGSAMSCQQRLVAANYVGASGYRQSVQGGPLAAPRKLSLNVHYDKNIPSNVWSHLFMFFGQLLDHDMTFTPSSTTVNNQAIQCCPPKANNHPQCKPIIIEKDDPFYSKFGKTCLNFVRSAMCPTCTLGPRRHVNQVTGWVDASFVYGSSKNKTSSLRTNDGTGHLRKQWSKYGDMLPPSPKPKDDQCSLPKKKKICFDAGDSRVNQHSILTSQQTMWMRQHNRLADRMYKVNPQWNGDKIFEEVRRILGALMQVFTYKEYLPIVLGPYHMSKYGLWVGYTTTYNDQVNPSIIEEFATAAYRFGHTLINSVITNCPLNSTNQPRLLRDDFFRPYNLFYESVGPLVKGASDSYSQSFDQHVVVDVTDYLYRLPGDSSGLDLAAININRGRDHGMPTYVEMVKYCSNGEIVVLCFSDLVKYNLMKPEQADVLQKNYRDVYDIDLWPGLLSEIQVKDGAVGPTGACIIAEQFYRLKYGDRFYFENFGQSGSFTYQQVVELRKMTYSKFICLNTDASSMNQNALLYSGPNNPPFSCRDVSDIDLSLWREKQENY